MNKKYLEIITMFTLTISFSFCQGQQNNKESKKTMPTYKSKRTCVPCESGASSLSQDQIDALMEEFTDWQVKHIDGIARIERIVLFKNFVEAMSFINTVAEIAEKEGHHPDLYIFYNKVVIPLYTHAISGLSGNDFIIADMIDDLIDGK